MSDRTLPDILDEIGALPGVAEAREHLCNFLIGIEELGVGSNPGRLVPPQVAFSFAGPRGTGKKLLADMLAEGLAAIYPGQHSKARVVQATDLGSLTAPDAEESLHQSLVRTGGVLMITEVDDLLDESQNDGSRNHAFETLRNLADALLTEQSRWSRHANRPKSCAVCIFVFRNREDHHRFLQLDPVFYELLGLEPPVLFVPLTTKDLVRVFNRTLNTYGPSVGTDLEPALLAYFQALPADRRNARVAQVVATRTAQAWQRRTSSTAERSSTSAIIDAEDLPVMESTIDVRETERSLQVLDQLVGLDDVMEKLHRAIETAGGMTTTDGGKGQGLHIALVGPPGTGKSTVAKLLAPLLANAGLIDQPVTHLARKTDLTSQYFGATPHQVKSLFERFMGGVILVDDAHLMTATVSSTNSDPYEDVAMKEMAAIIEQGDLRTTVVMAGETEGMRRLLDSVTSLAERFTVIEFPEPSIETNLQIAEILASRRAITFDEQARGLLLAHIRTRSVTPTWANGKSIDEIISALERIVRRRPDSAAEDTTPITSEEMMDALDPHMASGGLTPDEVLGNLVGLTSVKTILRGVVAAAARDHRRRIEGIATQPSVNHLAFLGAPGTGKTTVARLLAQMLYEAGVIRRPVLQEFTPADLISSGKSIGETTRAAIESSLDGLMFIDEAYGLVRLGGGQAIIDELVPAMEQFRDVLMVIFAGYPDEMKDLWDANPGLRGRVSKHIVFPHYSLDECIIILERLAAERYWILAPGAASAARQQLAVLHDSPKFANARTVRNLLDLVADTQAIRLQDLGVLDSATKEELSTLQAEDFSNANLATLGEYRVDEPDHRQKVGYA